jgi:hypothetical protein
MIFQPQPLSAGITVFLTKKKKRGQRNNPDNYGNSTTQAPVSLICQPEHVAFILTCKMAATVPATSAPILLAICDHMTMPGYKGVWEM